MRVELVDVTKGRDASSLPATSLSFQTGSATFSRAETAQRPTVLGLIASGRMKPETGSVTIDGKPDTKRMRAEIALIDAPDVCEPNSNATVAGVTAEELMFAGRPDHPIAVSRWLAEHGWQELSRTTMATLEPTTRVRLLTELAVLRQGVGALVIVSPDRHGGNPLEWWRVARQLAARGYAVLVIAGDAAATAIDANTTQKVSSTVPADTVPLFGTTDETSENPA